MIPKYPFQIRVTFRVGGSDKRSQETRNFEFIEEAIAYRIMIMRKANVIQVQTLVVLDETGTNNRDNHHAGKHSR